MPPARSRAASRISTQGCVISWPIPSPGNTAMWKLLLGFIAYISSVIRGKGREGSEVGRPVWRRVSGNVCSERGDRVTEQTSEMRGHQVCASEGKARNIL